MANLFYADCYLRLMKKGDLQFETARDNLQGKNYNSKYTNGNTNNLFIPLSFHTTIGSLVHILIVNYPNYLCHD